MQYLMQIKLALLQNRRWLLLSSAIFLISLLLAGVFTIFTPEKTLDLFTEFFLQLENLGEKVFHESTTLQGFTTIFLNNWRAATLMMALGTLLGLFTLVGLIINGALIGVVAGLMLNNPLSLVVGILPHGVFELPAILIAAAFGLKLGWSWVRQPPPSKTRWTAFRANLSTTIRFIWPLVTVLLVIAALIEVTVTPYLLTLLN